MEGQGAGDGRLVVAAAVVDDPAAPRQLLAARRSAPRELAGLWELPGGKVEPGEDPQAALHREIREELGVTLTLGRLLDGPADGDWPISPTLRLRVWLASVTSGTPEPLLDHSELRWVDAHASVRLPWLPADGPIIAAVGLRG
ncbi:MAG TPA: (deoxy)nucleoside triphosphate pyrophosphohydrolase [Phototrophicaceae bacterium]|nr:(deoxy)nucleoside triphosphate pyrophosphohydrolase [Phototrophicaceae bacterium]